MEDEALTKRMAADQSSPEIHSVLLESSLESVDRGESIALEVAERAGFPDEDLHKLGMAVREALVNAVVHGNRYNSRKKVHFSVTLLPEQLQIEVIDEGEGFSTSDLPDPLAEENLLRQSGRGLLLIRAFTDESVFEPAPPLGTRARLVLYRRPGGQE